jgi:predicted cupin superfamily sugar epimerase
VSPDAARWIEALELLPHPEGGFFRETWRAAETVAREGLPQRFPGARSIGTAIVYLLRAGDHSRLHCLRADEVWHLYDGGPLHLHLFEPGAGYRRLTLGRDLANGESPQWVIPHGTWFGAEPAAGAAFALAGCTVTPGFEYEDFELGEREALLAAFPAHHALVERLTAAKE